MEVSTPFGMTHICPCLAPDDIRVLSIYLEGEMNIGMLLMYKTSQNLKKGYIASIAFSDLSRRRKLSPDRLIFALFTPKKS